MIQNSISQAIQGETKLVFKPSLEFYQYVKINPKRWGKIYKGKLEPTQSELLRISNYFNIPIESFFRITAQE